LRFQFIVAATKGFLKGLSPFSAVREQVFTYCKSSQALRDQKKRLFLIDGQEGPECPAPVGSGIFAGMG